MKPRAVEWIAEARRRKEGAPNGVLAAAVVALAGPGGEQAFEPVRGSTHIAGALAQPAVRAAAWAEAARDLALLERGKAPAEPRYPG